MKRFPFLLLAFCMLLTCLAIPAATADSPNALSDFELPLVPGEQDLVPFGLKYTLAQGKVTVTGYTGSDTELVIPDTIEGYPVTAIGNAAFINCYRLNSIRLPQTLVSIGEYAFGSCDLTHVEIPEGVISIGANAFYNNTWLSSIRFPKSIKSIGAGVVASCNFFSEALYPGTQEEWDAIQIKSPNKNLSDRLILLYGLGDANGDGSVSFADIQKIHQHLSTANKLLGNGLKAADANKDGSVSYSDIQRIYQHLSTDNKLS